MSVIHFVGSNEGEKGPSVAPLTMWHPDMVLSTISSSATPTIAANAILAPADAPQIYVIYIITLIA